MECPRCHARMLAGDLPDSLGGKLHYWFQCPACGYKSALSRSLK